MEGLELICFQIISHVGSARSCYIEAIHMARNRKFKEAEDCIAQGKGQFTEGHHAHATLISTEASGTQTSISLLLIHAEDQLMSAEAFGILAEEFIEVYRQIAKA